MNKIRISSIQRGCVYDGPGVRTTVFLKGCNLHCPWCCNPENINYKEEWYIDESRCINKKNIISKLCKECLFPKTKEVYPKCPFKVFESVSKDYSPSQLINELKKDYDIFKDSNGGVTFSGGEPLLHSTDLIPILKELSTNNISIWFETSLFVPQENVKLIIPYTQGIYVDLKLQPEIGFLNNLSYIDIIRKNLSIIQTTNIDIHYRIVFTDNTLKELRAICKYLNDWNIQSLEVLQCHNLGEFKMIKLGHTPQKIKFTEKLCKEFVEALIKNGVSVIYNSL